MKREQLLIEALEDRKLFSAFAYPVFDMSIDAPTVTAMTAAPVTSAKKICWDFTNFKNDYLEYGKDTTNVSRKNTWSQSEMSWQGNELEYLFNLPNKSGWTQKMVIGFDISSVYKKGGIIQVYAGEKGKEVKVGPRLHVERHKSVSPGVSVELIGGTFLVTVPSSVFKAGKVNSIVIYGVNVRVGGGQDGPNFNFSRVFLRNK